MSPHLDCFIRSPALSEEILLGEDPELAVSIGMKNENSKQAKSAIRNRLLTHDTGVAMQ